MLMSLGKLIRTDRSINIYRKSESKYLEDPIEEIEVNNISFDFLKQLVQANSDDPMLCDTYLLNEDQITKLNTHLRIPIVPDFGMFEYFLECYGIYEKEKK